MQKRRKSKENTQETDGVSKDEDTIESSNEPGKSEKVNKVEEIFPPKRMNTRDRTLQFIITHKRSLSVFCVLIMLTVAWFGWVQKLNEKKSDFISSDDTISKETNVITYLKKNMVMDTDFIIDKVYILDNTTLKMDLGTSIEVTEIGVLELKNGSKITCGPSGWEYNFTIHSEARVMIDDSIIEKIHNSDGGGSGGLRIESDDVLINNSIIRNCQGDGISIYCSSPNIFYSQIHGNGEGTSDHGIEITSLPSLESCPFISYCDIFDNTGSGIYIGQDSDPLLSQLSIHDNNDGITSESSSFTKEKIEEFKTGYDTDIIDFYSGKTTDSSHSISIPDGAIVSDASITFEKGSSIDHIETEVLTVSETSEWERGSFSNVEIGSSSSSLMLQKDNDKNSYNRLFYTSYDDGPVPDVTQDSAENYMNIDHFEGDNLDSKWVMGMCSGTGGEIDVDGNGYLEPVNYGTKTDDNWFGPEVTAPVFRADGSLVMEAGFFERNEESSMGQMNIDLLDEDGNYLIRCQWADIWSTKDKCQVTLLDDSGTLYTTGETDTYNDFDGKMKIERKDNDEIHFYIDNGNGYQELTLSGSPSSTSLNGVIAQIRVYTAKHDGQDELSVNKLDWISFSPQQYENYYDSAGYANDVASFVCDTFLKYSTGYGGSDGKNINLKEGTFDFYLQPYWDLNSVDYLFITGDKHSSTNNATKNTISAFVDYDKFIFKITDKVSESKYLSCIVSEEWNTSKWYHVTLTYGIDSPYDGVSWAKIYFDEELEAVSYGDIEIDATDKDFLFLGGSGSTDEYISCGLDEFSIYNSSVFENDQEDNVLLSDYYFSEGTYISEPLELNQDVNWAYVSWDSIEPSGTKIKVSTRTKENADGIWSPWSAYQNFNDNSKILSPKGCMIQFKAILQTTNMKKTPTLNSVSIGYIRNNIIYQTDFMDFWNLDNPCELNDVEASKGSIKLQGFQPSDKSTKIYDDFDYGGHPGKINEATYVPDFYNDTLKYDYINSIVGFWDFEKEGGALDRSIYENHGTLSGFSRLPTSSHWTSTSGTTTQLNDDTNNLAGAKTGMGLLILSGSNAGEIREIVTGGQEDYVTFSPALDTPIGTDNYTITQFAPDLGNGMALFFDGQDDYIEVDTSDSLNTEEGIILQAWVKLPQDLDNHDHPIIYKESQYELVVLVNGSLKGLINKSSNAFSIVSTETFNDNSWHHVALSYDGSAMRLFSNGNIIKEKAHTGDIDTSSNKLYIGHNDTHNVNFSGHMDDVLISDYSVLWIEDVILTSQYSANNYCYLDFEKEDKDEVMDISDYENDGVPHNFKRIPFFPDTFRVYTGTNATIVDPDLNDDNDDYYNNMGAHIVTGDNSGEMRSITDYDKASHTLTFYPPLPSTVARGDRYYISQWVPSENSSQALYFDGTNDYIAIPDSPELNPTKGISISASINISQIGSTYTILKKNNQYHLLIDSNGKLKGSIYDDGAWHDCGPTANALDVNIWQDVSLSYDGNNLRLYVNDEQVTSSSYTGSINTGSGTLHIGSTETPSDYFKGYLDNVSISDFTCPKSMLELPDPDFQHKYDTSGNFDKNQGTVQFWFKWDGETYSKYRYLFSVTDDDPFGFDSDFGTLENSTHVYLTDDKLKVNINAQGGKADHNHDIAFQPEENVWYFLTVIWDDIGTSGSYSQVYLGDQLKSAIGPVDTDYTLPAKMYVGSAGYGAFASGCFIDEFRIFDYAKESAHITKDYECYPSSGEFISGIIEMDSDVYWPRVAWEADEPSGTDTSIEVRTYSSGSWSSWSKTADNPTGSTLMTQADGIPYGEKIQYSITLETTDSSITPEIKSVSLLYSPYKLVVDSNFKYDVAPSDLYVHDEDYLELVLNQIDTDGHTQFLCHFNDSADADSAAGEGTIEGDAPIIEEGFFHGGLNVMNESGGVYNFDSTDNIDFTDGTIEFWVKSNWSYSDPSYYHYLFALTTSESEYCCDEDNTISIYLSNRNHHLNFKISGNGGTDHHIFLPIDWEEGEWHHVAASWINIDSETDDSSTYLVVDGNNVSYASNENIQTDFGTMASNFSLGSIPGKRFSFNGTMDEFCIFNYKKTPDQIHNSYVNQTVDSGTYTSKKYNMQTAMLYNTICWDEMSNLNGITVKAQIETATSEGGLDGNGWRGSDGTDQTYFTFSGQYISYPVENENDDWIRYKLFLDTSVGQSPNVTEARLMKENYPPTVNLDVGDDGSIEWYYNSTLTSPQIFSGTDFVDALNALISADIGGTCEIPLKISCSAGKVKITDLDITYKDFEGCSYIDIYDNTDDGIQLTGSSPMFYNCTIHGNNRGVSASNSSPTLYNSSIYGNTVEDMKGVTNSQIQVINTYHDKLSKNMDGTSKILSKTLLKTRVLDPFTNQPVKDATVTVTGGGVTYENTTDENGYVPTIILKEYTYDTTNKFNHYLYSIEVKYTGKTDSKVGFTPEINKTLSIYYDGDSDGDLVTDPFERNDYVVCFEAEKHVTDPDNTVLLDFVADGARSTIISSSTDFHTALPVSGDGPYRVYFKANVEDDDIEEEVNLKVYDELDNQLENLDFNMSGMYRWYSSKELDPGASDSLRVKISTVGSLDAAYIDQIIIVETDSTDFRNLSNPLDYDTDGDMIFDGLETRISTEWFEGEHLASDWASQCVKYANTSNGWTCKEKGDDTDFISFQNDFVTKDYYLYIRGKGSSDPENPDDKDLEVAISNNPTLNYKFTDEFRWYVQKITISTAGTQTITFEDLQNNNPRDVYVDKFAFVLAEDVEDDKFYEGEISRTSKTISDTDFGADGKFDTLKFKIPNSYYVSKVEVTGEYSQLLHEIPGNVLADDSTFENPSVYKDYLVWDGFEHNYQRNLIYLYDLSLDSDGDGLENYLDDDDDGDESSDTYGTNDDDDFYVNLNGIAGFQYHSLDEIWDDTDDDDNWGTGDTCKYKGIDGTASTKPDPAIAITADQWLVDEEVDNNVDDDGDGSTDEDCRDLALYIVSLNSTSADEPTISSSLIAWQDEEVDDSYLDIFIYNLYIDTDADGTPNIIDDTDYDWDWDGNSDYDTLTYGADFDYDANDSDNDNYCTGQELQAGTDPYDSNDNPGGAADPFTWWIDEEIHNWIDDDGDSGDQDSDGWCDGEEVLSNSDPTDGSESPSDLDFDGWSDALEVLLDTDPNSDLDYPSGDNEDYWIDEDCADPAIIIFGFEDCIEKNADSWDDKVVFQSYKSDGDIDDDWDIYVVNVSGNDTRYTNVTGKEADDTDEENPAIYGTSVVWQDNRNSDENHDWDVYWTSIAGSYLMPSGFYRKDILNKEIRISKSTESGDHTNPDIYGENIVWESIDNTGDVSRIYWKQYFDINLDGVADNNWIELDSQLPGNHRHNPRIDGTLVVFSQEYDDINHDYDIFLYDLEYDLFGAPKKVINITDGYNNSQNARYPVISHDRIAWQDARGNPFKVQIFLCSQNYSIDVNQDGIYEWTSTRYPIDGFTADLTESINFEMEEYRNESGDVVIPFDVLVKTPEFNQNFEFKINSVALDFELIVDPLDPDTDMDGLFDGEEFMDYYGYDRVEFEDAIDFKEWNNSVLNFIHQTGVTLTTSNNFDNDFGNGSEDSWIRMRCGFDEGGRYKLSIEPNHLISTCIPVTFIQQMGYLGPVKKRIFHQPKTTAIRESPALRSHITEVFNQALTMEIRDSRGAVLPVDVIMDSIVLKSIEVEEKKSKVSGNFYKSAEVHLWWDFDGIVDIEDDHHYEILISLCLEAVPDTINDAFGDLFDKIDLIEIIDLDYIRVDRDGRIDAMNKDTDADGLTDGEEAIENYYPLNDDVDDDGLSDYDEMTGATKTDPELRDSDGDCIRDGVELGMDDIDFSEGKDKSWGSWIERLIINENPYDYSEIPNYDSAPQSTTDPNDSDTDGDGLPDGWIDGWIYEPFPFSKSDIPSFNPEQKNLQQLHFWQYDIDHWRQGGEIDLLQQIFEGEDFNLDGEDDFDDQQDSYSFDTDRMEISYEDGECSETDPGSADSDGDYMPDGYEVWFTHVDPIFTIEVNPELMLNPRDSDGEEDRDLDFELSSDVNSYLSTETDGTLDVGKVQSQPTVYAVAQEIKYDGGNEATLSQVQLHLDLEPSPAEGEVAKLVKVEIWNVKSDGQGIPLIGLKDTDDLTQENGLLATGTITERVDGWFTCNFKDIHFNDTEDKDPYIVLRYMGWNDDENNPANYDKFEWYYQDEGESGEVYYIETWDENQGTTKWSEKGTGQGESKLKLQVKYFYYDSTNTGDKLRNVDEYTVGTNPKIKNTDDVGDPVIADSSDIKGEESDETGRVNDGLIDGIEIGWDTGEDVPKGGVIFRTNIRDGALCFDYYGDQDGSTNGRDNELEWIRYDGDGDGGIISVEEYRYSKKLVNPFAYSFACQSDNIQLFKLRDDTNIYLSAPQYDSMGSNYENKYIFVWSPGVYLSDNDYDEDDTITGTCYVYEMADNPPSMDQYDVRSPLVGNDPTYWRNCQLFISDPFDPDSDDDGILDGREVYGTGSWENAWKVETEETSHTIIDKRICARDPDSDNDGLTDIEEGGPDWDLWNKEVNASYPSVVLYDPEPGDTRPSFLDFDSDDDGLSDGEEEWQFEDRDNDDRINMFDNDSDNDGIEDSWELISYALRNDTVDDPYHIYNIYDASDPEVPQSIDLFGNGTVIMGVENQSGDKIIALPDDPYYFDPTYNSGENDKEIETGITDLKDIATAPNGTIYYTTASHLKMKTFDWENTYSLLDNSDFDGHQISFGNVYCDMTGNIFFSFCDTTDQEYRVYKMYENFHNAKAKESLIELYSVSSTNRIITDLCVDGSGNIFFFVKESNPTQYYLRMLPSNYSVDEATGTSRNSEICVDILTKDDGLNELKGVDVDSEGNIVFSEKDGSNNYGIRMLKKDFDKVDPVVNSFNIEDVFSPGSQTAIYGVQFGESDIFYCGNDDDSHNDRANMIKYSATRMTRADSDSDGVNDYVEVDSNEFFSYGSNFEQTQPSFQLVKDSDGDGVSDGLELTKTTIWYEKTSLIMGIPGEKSSIQNVWSNPTDEDNDTDDDGIEDMNEIFRRMNPADVDTDGDGVNDGVEDANKNAFYELDELNPVDRDTDDDRLPDGWMDGYILYKDGNGDWVYGEKNDYKDGGIQPWEGEDQNGDGLIAGDSDADRFYDSGETWTETSPYTIDSDNDGVGDGDECLFILDMGGDDNRIPSDTQEELVVNVGDPDEPYSSFTCDADDELTGKEDDFCERWLLYFTSGNNQGKSREILSYTTSTRTFTVTEGFPLEICTDDEFHIIGYTIWDGYLLTDYDIDDDGINNSLEKDSDDDGLDDGVENRDRDERIDAFSRVEDFTEGSLHMSCWSKEDWTSQPYLPKVVGLELPSRDYMDRKNVLARLSQNGDQYLADFSYVGDNKIEGTGDAGGSTSTLKDSDLDGIEDAYVDYELTVKFAAHPEETRTVESYDATNKIITVETAFSWTTVNEDYELLEAVHGTADGGSTSTLIDDKLILLDDYYKGWTLIVKDAQGDEERTVESYDGFNRTIHINGAALPWSASGKEYILKANWNFDNSVLVDNGTLYISADDLSGNQYLKFVFTDTNEIKVNQDGQYKPYSSKLVVLGDTREGGKRIIFDKDGANAWDGIYFDEESYGNLLFNCEILNAKGLDGSQGYSVYCGNQTNISNCDINGDGLADTCGVFIRSNYCKVECSVIDEFDTDTDDFKECGIRMKYSSNDDADAIIIGNEIDDNYVGVYCDMTGVDYPAGTVMIKQNSFTIKDVPDATNYGVYYSHASATDSTRIIGNFFDTDEQDVKYTNCNNTGADGLWDDYLDVESDSFKDHDDYYYASEANPYNEDSDGDGILDGKDLYNSFNFDENGIDLLEWFCDFDGDGLINAMDTDSDDDTYFIDRGDNYEDKNHTIPPPDPSPATDHNGRFDFILDVQFANDDYASDGAPGIKGRDDDQDGGIDLWDPEVMIANYDNPEDAWTICGNDSVVGDSILPGNNQIFDSTLAGDDVIKNLQGSGLRIYSGPNGILETSVTSDDTLSSTGDDDDINEFDMAKSDEDEDGVIDEDEGPFSTSDVEFNPLCADEDMDGIRDGVEMFYGTDPLDEDSDDDGVEDGREPKWNLDCDGDGIINALDKDSDSDGIPDGKEDTNGDGFVDPLETDPLNPDTDNDGLYDGWIDANYNGDQDEGEIGGEGDKDGIINGDTDKDREWDSGEPWTETNPLDVDTDDDGLPDGWIDINHDGVKDFGEFEDKDCDGVVDTGTYYGVGAPGTGETNPLDWDSDDDGLPDGLEVGLTEKDISNDTNVSHNHFWSDADNKATKTDPTDSDSDDDGIPDGWIDLNSDGEKTMLEGEDLNLDGAIGGDDDLDGEWDLDEEWNETNPCADSTKIYYAKDEFVSTSGQDTDGDGLEDGKESGLSGYDGDFGATTTDPLSEDTDGDGLPDGWIDGWGYDFERNEWGLYNSTNTKKDRLEGEDFSLDGVFNEQPTFFYEDGHVISETIPDIITDRNNDGIPDGTDTDGDYLQDGLEELGWYVEVYYERNPNIRFPAYHVWSDPLDNDTDDDGLDDMNESLYGGDPEKSDTDGDLIDDVDENKAGSAVDGIEAMAPRLKDGLELSRGYDWKWKKKWGLPVGVRIEVEITVGGILLENVCLESVYIRVSGLGARDDVTLYPETEEEKNSFDFEHTFEFKLSMKRLVGDFFAGWDILVKVADANGNTAQIKDHLSSVVGALLDVLLDALAFILDMIWEWIKGKVLKLVNKVKSYVTATFSPLKENVLDLINLWHEENANEGTRSDGWQDKLLKGIVANGCIWLFSIVILGILKVVEGFINFFTGGSTSIVTKLGNFFYHAALKRVLFGIAIAGTLTLFGAGVNWVFDGESIGNAISSGLIELSGGEFYYWIGGLKFSAISFIGALLIPMVNSLLGNPGAILFPLDSALVYSVLGMILQIIAYGIEDPTLAFLVDFVGFTIAIIGFLLIFDTKFFGYGREVSKIMFPLVSMVEELISIACTTYCYVTVQHDIVKWSES